MTGKATVIAPSTIAFIKYWGARDLERVFPMMTASFSIRAFNSRSGGFRYEYFLSFFGVVREAPLVPAFRDADHCLRASVNRAFLLFRDI